eukprot:123484-Amphidinium_carterae.1
MMMMMMMMMMMVMVVMMMMMTMMIGSTTNLNKHKHVMGASFSILLAGIQLQPKKVVYMKCYSQHYIWNSVASKDLFGTLFSQHSARLYHGT